MSVSTLDRAPERSLQQRLDALAKGNRIRTRRAQIKRDLKARRLQPVEVLAEPPAELESMKVRALLMCVPKIGQVKADAMLRKAVVSPSKNVGGLSTRQRAELGALLLQHRR